MRCNTRWLSNYQLFLNLLGTVSFVIVGFVSGLFTIFTQVFTDYKVSQRSYRALERITKHSKRILGPKLKGIPFFIQRNETQTVLDRIDSSTPVILTGEAGTGKSGIAVDVMDRVNDKGMFCVLIDSRTLTGVNNKGDLRTCFDIEESFFEVIEKLGKFVQVVLIVDQIDNIVGIQACDVVVELLTTCATFEGVSVMAISRRREANEYGAIRPLIEANFDEVICQDVQKDVTVQILHDVGFDNVPNTLLALAQNLLNLDMLCEIIHFSDADNLQNVNNEIGLWEHYRLTLHNRENIFNNSGDEFISEATTLAQQGLASVDRTFNLDVPPTAVQRRLISGNVINKLGGRKHQFSHEKLQDYLFASYSCECNFGLEDIRNLIGQLHERNVIVWMLDIYQKRNDAQYGAFLEEVLDG